MKKYSKGSRLLSLLLAVVMVVSVLPLSVFAAVGDMATGEKAGDTGLDGNIDTTNTISWPIKVYDFLNDGMLFEFANANDATDDISDTLGGAYGGGMPAPQFEGAVNIVGTDFTVDWGYREYAYTNWFKNYSDFNSTAALVEAVNFECPRHLHLVPNATYTDMEPWLMSDYYSDNTISGYPKDTVRYAVIVYRTKDLQSGHNWIELGWCTDQTGEKTYKTIGNYTYTYTCRGSVEIVANDDAWNYVVVDMKAGALAGVWDKINAVYNVFIDIGMTNPSESFDISHVAYFGTEFEAIEFGKDAVAFDNDPGEFLDAHTEYTSEGEPAPTVSNNGWDFTTTGSSSWSDSTYTGWSSVGMTTTKVTSSTPTYMNVSNTDSDNPDYATFWSSSSYASTEPGHGTNSIIRYITIVYRTHGITSPKIGFWLEDTVWGDKVGNSSAYRKSISASETTWVSCTIDLRYLVDDYGLSFTNKVDTFNKIGVYFPGFVSGQSMDIAFVDYFSDLTTANTFGAAGAAYMNNPGDATTTTEKKWNTGSNVAFGMLFSNYGGGWNYSDNINGGANTWANGYYSYQIGQTVTSDTSNAQNAQRTEAAQKGYPVSNSIFLLNESATGMTVPYATDGLDFGYTLINTLTSGLYTAGLLESGLITVTDKNGNSYRVPNYKEETVEYIAQMLMDALSIGQTDTSGNYNYNFVKGTANGEQYGYDNGKALDLASALRKQLKVVLPANGGNCTSGRAALGTYAETAAKKSSLIGSFADCKDSITTFMDAAYYLLHNLYVNDSYNQTQNDYDYLVLSSASVKQSDGTTKSAYVFDGGFTTGNVSDTANTEAYRANSESAVKYDTTARTISLTSAASKDQVYFQGTWTTSRFPFLPITDSEGIYAGETKSPYFLDDGRGPMGVTEEGASFVNRNYNYAIACNGEFVYHAEDDLFFQFEGDDDVYLFINGELVLDIGAAHSVTDVSMQVNDYVTWAQKVLANHSSYSETDVARAEKLNLQEGESYSFDFYYMERHGWGANCRIVSNIQVTDPAMKTDKTAYQDDVEVSYGGIVNTDEPIEYSFTITNNGNSKLYNLSFEDKDIGVTLDSTNGLKVTGSTVCDLNGKPLDCTDLVAYVYTTDSDGNKTDIKTITFKDGTVYGETANGALINFLKTLAGEGLQTGEEGSTTAGGGLWTGWSVTIRGIGYKMTDADKNAGNFDNTVYTTANSQANGEGKTLQAKDTHLVYKAAEPMYYQWAGHELTVSIDKLRDDVVDAASKDGNALNGQIGTLPEATAISKFELCLRNGTAWSYTEITASGNNLLIKYSDVGSYVFYVKLYYDTNTLVVPVLVNVTDVKDQVYVLDYGLKATTDLFKGATLTVPARATSYQIMGLTGTVDSGASAQIPSYLANENRISFTSAVTVFSSYAYNPDGNAYTDMTYSIADGKVTFTPGDFMDDVYNLWTAVTVYDTTLSTPSALSGGTININKEVQMYQKTTVLPASVVYYEDDFPAIHYESVTTDGTISTTNVITQIGSSRDLTQSVDQEQNYGQDETYQDNSEYSGNSQHKIEIKDANNFAWFEFKGTGFELIASTEADSYATIVVTVVDANGEEVQRIPVINQFDNGNNGGNDKIYQVPVIRVKDLAYGTYKVYINGAPAYDYSQKDENGNYVAKVSYLYLDGLRIYSPLGSTSNEYYNDNENGAAFAELRNLIAEGFVASVVHNGSNVYTSTGTTTWTEDLLDEYTVGQITANQVSSVNDYLTKGPNNEVYINGTVDNAALVFYVKENSSSVHNLQIAVHAVDEGLFVGSASVDMNAVIKYGIRDGNSYKWEPLVTVTSGTEQYYTIPYANCPYVAGVGYQVAIYVESGMASFTSLKYNGLEINSVIGTVTNLKYDNGILVDQATNEPVATANYVDFQMVAYQMLQATVEPDFDDSETGTEPIEPEETKPTEPEGTEPTEPDVTEPEETKPTEPDVTEPDETEPTEPEETEPTEPDVTEPDETEPTEPEETKPGKDGKPGKDDKPGKGDKPGTGGGSDGNQPGHDEDSNKNLWQTLLDIIKYLLGLIGNP